MASTGIRQLEAASYLTERGVEIFEELAGQVKGDMLPIDSVGLSMLSQMIDRIEYCSRAVNNGQDVEISSTGWRQISPEAKELKDLQNLMLRYMTRYGLTPEDRAKLTQQDKKTSKLDKI